MDLLVLAGADIRRPITEVGDVLVCLCLMCSMGCNCVVNVSVYASLSRFLYNFNNKGSVLLLRSLWKYIVTNPIIIILCLFTSALFDLVLCTADVALVREWGTGVSISARPCLQCKC